MKEIFNREEIKILFKKCSQCNGKGYTDEYSHGCWGEPEWRCVVCSSCNSYGFTIRPDFVKAIKETIL